MQWGVGDSCVCGSMNLIEGENFGQIIVEGSFLSPTSKLCPSVPAPLKEEFSGLNQVKLPPLKFHG